MGAFSLTENEAIDLVKGEGKLLFKNNERPLRYDLKNSSLFISKMYLSTVFNTMLWASHFSIECTIMSHSLDLS